MKYKSYNDFLRFVQLIRVLELKNAKQWPMPPPPSSNVRNNKIVFGFSQTKFHSYDISQFLFGGQQLP